MTAQSLNTLKVAAFSSVCVDHYPQKGIVRAGGNSLNFAVHAKRSGAGTVSVAGFIGTDSHAEMIVNVFKNEHVDISHLYRISGNTASNRIYNISHGERYSNDGDWNNGVKNAAVLSEPTWDYMLRHDIIAVPHLDMNLSELMKRRSDKHLVTVDFMHFDDCDIIREYLPRIDMAFVSPQPGHLLELQNLAYEGDNLIIALLGAQGSKAFHNGKEYFQPAAKVPAVIDTTGCGDSYQAAFACSYFFDKGIQKAMLVGAERASTVLSHYGAVEHNTTIMN